MDTFLEHSWMPLVIVFNMWNIFSSYFSLYNVLSLKKQKKIKNLKIFKSLNKEKNSWWQFLVSFEFKKKKKIVENVTITSKIKKNWINLNFIFYTVMDKGPKSSLKELNPSKRKKWVPLNKKQINFLSNALEIAIRYVWISSILRYLIIFWESNML